VKLSVVLLIVLAAVVQIDCRSCGSGDGVSDVRAYVDRMARASEDAMLKGEVDALLDFYEESATSLPPNSQPVVGRSLIRSYMDSVSAYGITVRKVEFTPLTIDVDGNLAYEVGKYSMTMHVPTVGLVLDEGNYMAIWRRQPDDTWKVHTDIWNTNIPIPLVYNQ
jgi:ketosteroid isomerase-like protein